MRIVERIGDFGHDANGFGNWKLFFAVEAIAQRLARHERHYVEECSYSIGARCIAGIEQRQDMWVGQGCRELYFAQEALGSDRLRDLGAEHLDGDQSSMTQVACAMNRGHSANPNLGFEFVSVTEGGHHACGMFSMETQAVSEPAISARR